MADEIDQAQAENEHHQALALSKIKPYELPKGVPGDCDLCGEWSGRLISGACAPCRERYKLP